MGKPTTPGKAPTPAASVPAPHPLTSVFQQTITIGAVCIAAVSVFFAVRTSNDERNARLVEIGVRVLLVDPTKEKQVRGAREWAIDLIDANAGVKFSPEARAELLNKPLGIARPSAIFEGAQSRGQGSPTGTEEIELFNGPVQSNRP